MKLSKVFDGKRLETLQYSTVLSGYAAVVIDPPWLLDGVSS